MSYSELIEINDYISAAEHSFDNNISTEQRIGVVNDLDKVISCLHKSRISNPELSSALTELEERAEKCRNVFKNLSLRCRVNHN
ncbi:MAG: hypothetical protein JW912_04625 [Sedimentisphaerales bacterium]|nr:hypothetical protein [Sedimentisphaerales bacterium]